MTQIKLAKSSFNTFTDHLGMNNWSSDDVDKLEIPDLKKYKEIVKQCKFFYRRDPLAASILNKLIEIGITKLSFGADGLSANELRIFTSISDKLMEFAEICALEFLLSGLVIPEIRYEAVSKDELIDLGIKKYTTLTLPISMWVRDPSTVKIEVPIIPDDPSYYVVIPEDMIFFIINKGTYPSGNKDLELYQKLLTYYPEFVEQVNKGNKEVLLDNPLIIRRRYLSDCQYPLPYLYPALESMKHKRNLRRMDYSIASRAISAIQLIKLGDKDFPVTEDDEDAFAAIRDQMTWRYSGGRDVERIYQLFGNHTLTIEWVYPPMDILQSDVKYKEINQDIFFGLGFPRILITGETERSGSSNPDIASLSPIKTMRNIQQKILFIIRGITNEIAKLNGLKSSPTVKFKPINLASFRDFVTGMQSLYDSGNISRHSYTDAFGYDWDDETDLRESEQDILKEKGLEEFSPQPFSPKPGVPGKAPMGQPKKEPEEGPEEE